MPHSDDFKTKGHGVLAERGPQVCWACHKTQECLDCHAKLTKSPHPDTFALEHKTAKFVKDSTCLFCHKFEYCQQCHPDAKLK